MHEEQWQQRQQQWSKIEAGAYSLLRRGHARGYMTLFQVAVFPSFDPAISWEVCRNMREDSQSYLVVRSEWRPDVDRENLKRRDALLPIQRKVLSPLEPTIEVRQIALPTDWCEAMQEKLQRIQVPISIDRSTWVGLDGTSYELALSSGFITARFGWWEEAPAPWRPLEDFVREVLGTVEAL